MFHSKMNSPEYENTYIEGDNLGTRGKKNLGIKLYVRSGNLAV